MDFFAMFFAIFMIAAAVAATIAMYVYAGGVIAALVFAGVLVTLYRLITRDNSYRTNLDRDELNAFQRSLADD